MEAPVWTNLHGGGYSSQQQPLQHQQQHLGEQQAELNGQPFLALPPWLVSSGHHQQEHGGSLGENAARAHGDCCPKANDPASFQQDEGTYETFGSAYHLPAEALEGSQGPASDLNGLDIKPDILPHDQQLDDATELPALSFEEIMAAFAQAAEQTSSGQPPSDQSHSLSPPTSTSFGLYSDVFGGHPDVLDSAGYQRQSPPYPFSFSTEKAGAPAFEHAYPSPYLASGSQSAPSTTLSSLSPLSQQQPSPPHPHTGPFSAATPHPELQQLYPADLAQPSIAPPSFTPLRPQPPQFAQHLPPPPPPPPPSVTQADSYVSQSPGFARSRGSRKRVDPSHTTGGLDVAASMSLMGVTERDETDETSGWDDFEFGVHTKPPFAPMVDRVLERGRRFDLGERSIIVMTPKVAQKSYGTEKRFLCPPPSAVLAGKAWFDPLIQAPDHTAMPSPLPPDVYFPSDLAGVTFASLPPSVSIAITHELSPAIGSTQTHWVSSSGTPLRFTGVAEEEGEKKKSAKSKGKAAVTVRSNAGSETEVAVYGMAVNRSVYVTEGVATDAEQATSSKELHTGLHTSGKMSGTSKRVVKACVKVVAPALPGQEKGIEIGAFESREIKVISKPARKKISINHGTLVSVFQRHKSQSASTRFLSIFDSAAFLRSSDGERLVTEEVRRKRLEEGQTFRPPQFQASTTTWDGFIIWKVDVKTRTKQQHVVVPPEPDWPPPPPMAMAYNPATPAPIHFNHTVILQCPKTGATSPILIVRRVDEGGRALGGHLTHLHEDHPCMPSGEGIGEAVSQLQKVAFEIYQHSYIPLQPDSAGKTGHFLSITGDDVRTEFPSVDRQLFPPADVAMVPAPAPPAPELTPDPATISAHVETDQSNDGGKVKRRSSSSKGKGSRSSSVGSTRGRRGSASSDKAPAKSKAPPEQPKIDNPPRWWIHMNDNAIWTIIGVESVRYSFVVPRLRELQPASLSGPALYLGALHTPVTPLPALLRYLEPKPLGQNEESINIRGYDTKFLTRTTRKMITLYGTAFKKDPNRSDSSWELFIGHRRAPHVELRCQEVMAAVLPAMVPPSLAPGSPPAQVDKRDRLLSLVRKTDGVLIPSALEYGV